MEDQLIEDYHILILGALKKCHVTKHHHLFEDYLQISRWVLIDCHRSFIKDNQNMDGFHNYVFQRIYWKITDEIRKELIYNGRLYQGEAEDVFKELPDTQQEDVLEIHELLEKCQSSLTTQELLFLKDAFLNELSITEISKKHHVSRQTVYNWRSKVALKIIIFLK